MSHISTFIELTRLKKPIGFMLLFWPCAWGLTIAYDFQLGIDQYLFYMILFFSGSVLMRSAGCIINDIADKDFDKKVERTKNRPLASGKISIKLALTYSIILCIIAFIVLINFNFFTIILAIASMPLAFSYPLMKRFTYWPQLFLGITFNAVDLICLLLFIGAMGKSAQILLHTWLPDAMEGPTPVSALIHAATMVTAGVFLVVRCSPIYEYSDLALNIITIVGMSTAFFAATVALLQNDIKKIIAYSTCSQLGYMFFATGVGAYNVAMFHLFTHAFFKALLFLGSGSVIHAFKDEQNINNMGGVWKKLPYTYSLMIIGTLALTGFPFLSGFYSKDAIIEFAYLRGNTTGYYAAGIGIFTAFLTSIYSWRLIFKTFHGEYNNKEIKIDETHESPIVMLIPLVLLSIGAIFAGFLFKELFIGYEGLNNFWRDSIFFLKPLSTDHPPLWFLLLTPTLVILSIPLAYYLFLKNKNLPERLASINKPLYQFLLNKWYFDELYDVLFVKPSKKLGLFLWKFFDLKIIDGFGPDGISSMIKKFSVKANKFQSGYIYQYAFVMLLGFSALLTFLIVK